MERIGVVGAGLMGSEIALVFALAGHDVVLSDRSEAEVSAALERRRGILSNGIERGLY
jgi:3-hydroxybutyryl-CoA dehydrogenase